MPPAGVALQSTTVNPGFKLYTSVPVVTVIECGAAAAPVAMVNGSVNDVLDTEEMAPTLMPVPLTVTTELLVKCVPAPVIVIETTEFGLPVEGEIDWMPQRIECASCPVAVL
jgi:hypothetical protein